MIPPQELWSRWARILNPVTGVVVLTASQPFTSIMVMSKLDWFRVEWIFSKSVAANFIQVGSRPLKYHENIIVFSPTPKFTYNPQMRRGEAYSQKSGHRTAPVLRQSNAVLNRLAIVNKSERFPSSIISVPSQHMNNDHPTQKPVALFAYLILTYSNPDNLVLDCCIGSGTTAEACLRTGRRFIGMEKNEEYYKVALERVLQTKIELGQMTTTEFSETNTNKPGFQLGLPIENSPL